MMILHKNRPAEQFGRAVELLSSKDSLRQSAVVVPFAEHLAGFGLFDQVSK